MKRLFRLIYIIWTCWRLGLDELVWSHFKQPWMQRFRVLLTFWRKFKEPRGVRVRIALERLGPIFVKFGQLLSTRRDLVPLDIADELALLQDQVPPFDSQIAFSIIEASLKKKLSDIFVSIDDQPSASASIAQVYFGIMQNRMGEHCQVAIKVLRPNMEHAIEQDLSLLRTLAKWVERISSDGKRLKPREVVAEFDKYLHDELDLLREASNAAQIRRNMSNLHLVIIPEVYWDYCTTNVMVMERMEGVPISQKDLLLTSGVDIKKLARDGVTIFFTQVFNNGFFHADMHPGNILVSLRPQSFSRYILLDFGIVGSLTETDKEYLAQNFAAFFRRDYKRVAELHIESKWVPPATRVDELEAAIRAVCEPYFDRPLREISLGMVLLRLFQASRRFQVEIQPQLVLLQKTLLNVEGLGRELDPDLDLWATAKPFLDKWMRQQIGPRRFFKELRDQAPRYAKLLPDLPYLLYSYLQHQQHATPDPALLRILRAQRKSLSRLRSVFYLLLGLLLGLGLAALIYLHALG